MLSYLDFQLAVFPPLLQRALTPLTTPLIVRVRHSSVHQHEKDSFTARLTIHSRDDMPWTGSREDVITGTTEARVFRKRRV